MAAGDEAAASERFVAGPDDMSTGTGHRDNLPSPNTHNFHHQNESRGESQVPGTPSSSSSPDKNSTLTNVNKGRTCKGCLYYSSAFKSNSRDPVCVGFTRSYPNVPRNIIKSEVEASQAGSRVSDFKYGCLGFSAYAVHKGQPDDEKEKTTLPVCVGIEVLVDKRVRNAAPMPTQMHNKEDGSTAANSQTRPVKPSRPVKPAQPVHDEFLTRFQRNANLVAMGVVKNMRKVGNQIKESVDDILYPYRRRPK